MATDFIMPRMPTDARDPFFQPPQQPHQLPPVNQQFHFQSQYNPQISPLSTSNSASPHSPKSNYHKRQQRLMYIPAVLRPTEHPSREISAKTAKDKAAAAAAAAAGEEGEDGDDLEGDESPRSSGVRSSGSFINLPGLGAFGIGRLSRRSTNDSGKCVDDTWNLDLFPEVTGPPTRSHWKPDTESTMCDEPTCKKTFNYFTRRHHCRRCGNIFCDFHSAFEVPLDENANYNPRGAPSRACAYCFREFKTWRSRTNSSDISRTASDDTMQGAAGKGGVGGVGIGAAGRKAMTAPTSPVMALVARAGAPGTPTVAKVLDVAQSVPGDWNWSTF